MAAIAKSDAVRTALVQTGEYRAAASNPTTAALTPDSMAAIGGRARSAASTVTPQQQAADPAERCLRSQAARPKRALCPGHDPSEKSGEGEERARNGLCGAISREKVV